MGKASRRRKQSRKGAIAAKPKNKDIVLRVGANIDAVKLGIVILDGKFFCSSRSNIFL